MSTASFNGFLNYKQTIMDLTGDLKQLKEYSQKFELQGNVSSIDDMLKRLAEDTFSVAIVGEFKRGKSTLINALLEKDVLPTDVLPTTATLNRVTYSVTPFARIEYNDGKTEDIDISRLNDYVTKLTPQSEQIAKTIRMATVFYPINYCKNGVTIIDTPGLNDNDDMNNVTLSVLPQIDAAIMVIMAGAPFSQSECDFLENKIIASDLGRVLFVVTGIDLYDEDDARKILNNITARITNSVLLKAKNTYGENSKEYDVYKSKLGSLKVYGVSAKKALKAKQKGDNAMLGQSGFPEFEDALEHFLTEDRGAVSMSAPINRIKTSSLEIVKAAKLREAALSMQKEAFNANYNKAMEEMAKIRGERQEEFSRVNEAAQQAYQELIPIIQEYWPALEKAAEQAIEDYSISSSDELKGPAADSTQEGLTNAVKRALSRESQRIAERVQTFISSALEKEAGRLSGFEEKFYSATEAIQNLFIESDAGKSSGLDTAIGIAGNYFWGIGGLYTGFKEAGWKGALLGGATGLAGTFATSFGAGLLLSVLAIPLSWPVLLIVGIGSAIVGTFSSRWAVGKFFAKDKIERFKKSFAEATLKQLRQMQAENDFSDAVRQQITSSFDALKDKLRTETENVLNDTQTQLDRLKADIAKNEGFNEREKEDLVRMLSNVDQICLRADGIGKQLAAILSK